MLNSKSMKHFTKKLDFEGVSTMNDEEEIDYDYVMRYVDIV